MNAPKLDPPVAGWLILILMVLASLVALLLGNGGCSIAGEPCPDMGCPEGQTCVVGRCLPERGRP